MKNRDDLRKELEKLKEELDKELLDSDEALDEKANELLEKFFSKNKGSLFLMMLKQILFNLLTLTLSFFVSYAFFVDSFSLQNKWFVLLIFVIMSCLVIVERLVSKFFTLETHTYLFMILGLFNITLFTLINYFVNFSSDIILFNMLYIGGILFYTLFNFMLLRHKFRKVDL